MLSGDKQLVEVRGVAVGGGEVQGYEIHVGRTTGAGLERPFLTLDGEGPHGAVSADGRIMGGYVHGLFQAGGFRRTILDSLGAASAGADHGPVIDRALDEIAEVLETSLDIAALARITGLEAPG